MSGWWVRLGGRPASLLGKHGAPTYETTIEGGLGEASFTFLRPPRTQPQSTRPRTRMEIMLGPVRVWWGTVLDYDDGTVIGQPLSRDLYNIPALDAEGAATRSADVAILGAVNPLGEWRHPLSDPWNARIGLGTALGDSDEVLMVGDLLDQCAEQNGARWGQDHDGNLRTYALTPDAAPRWMTAPAAGTLGPTSEGQASHLVLRYETGAGHATMIRSDPFATIRKAVMVDLTERGALTSGEVALIGDTALAAVRVETGWVNPLEVTARQLTTLGGARAFLPTVRAGQTLRLHSLLGHGVSRPVRDVVIGKTVYTAGARTIRLEAANTAPRNLTDVIAAS